MKIIDHIKNYNRLNFPDLPEDDYLETLQECGKIVHKETVNESRWWNVIFCVTLLDGRFIGFEYATATGDANPVDMGWVFSESSIVEMEKRTELKEVITYHKRSPHAVKLT